MVSFEQKTVNISKDFQLFTENSDWSRDLLMMASQNKVTLKFGSSKHSEFINKPRFLQMENLIAKDFDNSTKLMVESIASKTLRVIF